MELPVDLCTTWTREIRNGLTRTMRRLAAQGAMSTPGTRTSVRSAKAKGKEPESILPVAISEDEFELITGILEKVTHERTEFLHHICFLTLPS